jgi:phosphoribosyl-ATP pyrophosphohydrolase/phosphoribosyl-AMP cyclohydrolase
MKIDFEKVNGLVPVIIQDVLTSKVLMLGYMNEEALTKTQKEGKVTFFSRTKGRLWTKGETSGNFLKVREFLVDCDNDTILIKVQPVGPVCHKGTDTCFEEVNVGQSSFFHKLESVIVDRKSNPSEESYTNYLFSKGIKKIAQKVGEEAVEVVIDAVANDVDLMKQEAADLIYHLLVLLAEKDVTLNDIEAVLAERHAPK